jgi:hypothetical protein
MTYWTDFGSRPDWARWARYCDFECEATRRLYEKLKEKPMQPNQKCEWGVTAKPDWGRICRELRAAGATIGRVTVRTAPPLVVTLVDSGDAATWRNVGMLRASYTTLGAEAHGVWVRIEGDHVAKLLEPPPAPVKVEGFGPAPASVTTEAPPAASTRPKTAWVQQCDLRSPVEYLLGEPLNPVARGHVPTSGRAYLGTDGKVRMLGDSSRAGRLIGNFVPAPAPERFGIFCGSGSRSEDYHATFLSRAEAEKALEAIDPVARRVVCYHVRPL